VLVAVVEAEGFEPPVPCGTLAFEECEELVFGLVASGLNGQRGCSRQRAFFEREIGFDLCGLHGFVTEREGDDGGVDSGVQRAHRRKRLAGDQQPAVPMMRREGSGLMIV
jgi:hypothetical protein